MKRFCALALALAVSACAPATPPVLVTLTAPPATATVEPIDLTAAMKVGSTMRYTDGTTLVAVPSGPFKMGHGAADNPEHTVTLSDYWLYQTKVTNAQYAICVAVGRCTAPDAGDNAGFADFGNRNRPAVGVTYDQAQAYCNYMNAALPSEAQWEKAARGATGALYPWGDAQPSCDLLNFNNCVKHTTDVVKYAAGKSPYGALDMEGNAMEWVADWYDPLYYKASPPGDPPGPADGRARVQRGSSYHSNPIQTVAYARSFAGPRTHSGELGFRCAVSVPTYFAPACEIVPEVSEAQLKAASIDCPQISIDVQVTACRYGGGALVTFNDDHPQDPNASFGGIVGCSLKSGTPGSYPLSYACKQSSMASLSTSCTYSGIQGASCPEHYALDASTGLCKWDNSRTKSIECPSGYFSDPIHHCCMVETGKIVDAPVCPVGSAFADIGSGRYFCLPGSGAVSAPQVLQPINPPTCANTCNQSTELCAQKNLVFCSTMCTCISVGVKCPTH